MAILAGPKWSCWRREMILPTTSVRVALGLTLGPVGAVPEPIQAQLVVAPAPRVEHLAADAVVAAGQADVAGDLLGMAQDRQATLGPPEQLLLGHGVSSLVGDPECQPSPSVPYTNDPHACQ